MKMMIERGCSRVWRENALIAQIDSIMALDLPITLGVT